MPFEIVRNDITKMQVDAVVNTAHPKPDVGPGVDSMLHEKAGPQLLLARQKIGDISPGSAAITPAYGLDAQFVIHTVGPVWQGGGHGEARSLCRGSQPFFGTEGCRFYGDTAGPDPTERLEEFYGV